MSDRAQLPCSDEVVRARTGRDWSEWFALLEREEAEELSHRELARLCGRHHDAGGWWSQTIAVAYERHTGRRALHQESTGTFRASTSRTLSLAPEAAHRWFTDPERRHRWMDLPVEVRHATEPKSVHMNWSDGTSASVWISPVGEDRCRVSVEHGKLGSADDVPPVRTWWRDALGRLQEMSAGGGGVSPPRPG